MTDKCGRKHFYGHFCGMSGQNTILYIWTKCAFLTNRNRGANHIYNVIPVTKVHYDRPGATSFSYWTEWKRHRFQIINNKLLKK